MELTILMPCLNEIESLEFCIREAMKFLEDYQVDGEVLIADNGSTDGSDKLAEKLGARVINVKERGYGSALRAGIAAAYGKYVIMADSDGSYDFYNLMPYLNALRSDYDIVMGNRFWGTIEKDAFPFSHRYIGVPILSFLGRLAARGGPKDFHCGLRGVRKDSFLELNAECTGMEFASEMIILAARKKQKFFEIPTNLHRDKRKNSTPHLRTIPDGFRHLKVIFRYLF